jgi:hypothetical protein
LEALTIERATSIFRSRYETSLPVQLPDLKFIASVPSTSSMYSLRRKRTTGAQALLGRPEELCRSVSPLRPVHPHPSMRTSSGTRKQLIPPVE